MRQAWWLLPMLLSLAPSSGAEVLRVGEAAPTVQATLDLARDGDVVEVPPGRWVGAVRVEKSIILRGRGGVLDGEEHGTVVHVEAPGAQLEGLRIANSGVDVGGPDACVFIAKQATGAIVRGNELTRCGFGIWVHETDGVHLVDNRVQGRADLRTTDRGNGIHLFDASNLVVRGNTVVESRDGIYVSATEDSLIEGNHTSNQRFGIHYMYSYSNTLRGNVSKDNVLGIALMESLHLIVDDNVVSGNERNGLLFRDVQFSKIRRNVLEHNGIGMFFFSSTENEILDNRVAHNEIGFKIWAGSLRNRVEGNAIIGNRQQVFYVSAEDQHWGESGRGNIWGDYMGWDQDGDGIGDRPHRVDSFTAGLLYRYPAAVLLMRSPALETLAHFSDRLPALRTPTVIDVAPLLGEGN
jgi:nitrous oxidase accessory protein